MNVDHEKWCDVNVISSLLKAFFRKLPESLVTSGINIYLIIKFDNLQRTHSKSAVWVKIDFYASFMDIRFSGL